MLKEYGNWLRAWVCAMDVDKAGRVDKQQFAWMCEQMEYKFDAKKLFDIFDFDLSGSITLEEIDQKAFEALQRGDVRFERMHGSRRLTSSPKDFQAFFARQQNELQTRRSTINKEVLEKAREARRQSAAADVAMNALAGLRKQMKLKYGSMMRAWTLLFDKENTGKLPQSRCYQVLRDIGFKGPMEKCWKELDKENAGIITLKNFAEEEYALVEGLKQAMIAKSGSIVRC